MIRLFFLVLLIAVSGCRDNHINPDELESGYDFYPLNTGTYNDYKVSRISYDGSVSAADTNSYFLREVVADTFMSGGDVYYRLERFYKDNSNSPWPEAPDSVWTVLKNERHVIRTENNTRYISLVFPVEEGKSWNGNLWNVLDKEEYHYEEVNGNEVKVLKQADTTNFIYRDYRFDIFEKGTGLKERVEEELNYDDQKIGEYEITSGQRYYQILTDHGKL